ncbi:cytidine deaminase [Reinekea sp.]|jgi:cytidine deaminase|uniref:cytidine deaminase n=1 Tax=Reinekea sp. TaxID=1970455 RepID=UPI002A7F48A2|nr:cytidine deaminase [Reinekea sp.]
MTDHFTALYDLAKASAAMAYAPYSKFQVGAALATADGTLFNGCNVENGSYSLGLCAERNAITTAVAAGVKPGDIDCLVIFIDRPELFSPCGGCRQVMSEFMTPTARVSATNGNGLRKDWTMAELLPDGFQLPD